MRDIVLKVYNDKNEVVKEVKATEATIRFGAVRKLVKLLKVDEIDETGELLGIVLDAWNELIKILNNFFPEMEEEDWDNVNTGELIPVLFALLKDTFTETLMIPRDPKN